MLEKADIILEGDYLCSSKKDSKVVTLIKFLEQKSEYSGSILAEVVNEDSLGFMLDFKPFSLRGYMRRARIPDGQTVYMNNPQEKTLTLIQENGAYLIS